MSHCLSARASVCAVHPSGGIVACLSIRGFQFYVQKQRHDNSDCSVFSPGCAGAYGSSYGSGYGGNSMYGSTSMYGGGGYGMNSGYGSGYGGSSLYGGGGFGEHLPSCDLVLLQKPTASQCAHCGCSLYKKWRLWGAQCCILNAAQQMCALTSLLGCLSMCCSAGQPARHEKCGCAVLRASSGAGNPLGSAARQASSQRPPRSCWSTPVAISQCSCPGQSVCRMAA